MAQEFIEDEDDVSRREMNPDDFDEENEANHPKKLLESEHAQDPDDIDSGWGDD